MRKQLVQEAFIEECARVLPNAYASLIAQTIGTPRTYLTYIAKAAVGGGAMTVGRTLYHPIGSTTKHPRLFRAGESVWPGPGTLASALSGYYAARKIAQLAGLGQL